MKKLSIYIHIPFCKSKCAYCDFVSFKCNEESVKKYVQSLIAEINNFDSSGYVVDSIFFGGGTPTYLSEELFESIVNCINKNFKLDLKEFTVEGNPDSYTKTKVELYKSLGVTRLSVGVQSLNDKVLSCIGRVHNSAKAIECLNMLVNSGLDVNCDMMIGLPNQTLNIVKNDLKQVIACGVKSVSCYSLILEEDTPLYKNVQTGKIVLPNEDLTVDMYDLAVKTLQKSGLNRYEISNFGKPCLHNIGYWKLKEYIGFGLSAHSFIGNTRFYNTSNFDNYINGSERMVEEVLTLENMRKEYAMLSLRMDEGIIIEDYVKLFGIDGLNKLFEEIDNNIQYYNVSKKNIAIKPEFIYMSNSLIAELI